MELTDKVSIIKGIGPKKEKALAEKGIFTISDFMYFMPGKYEDRREFTEICNVTAGKDYMIHAVVMSKRQNPYGRGNKSPLNLVISDGTGNMNVVFFNGRFLSKLFNEHQDYVFYGRVSENKGHLQMAHPEFYQLGSEDDIRGIIPVYPHIDGISQKEIRKIQRQLLPVYSRAEEWLNEDTVSENRLASPSFAYRNIHYPENALKLKQSRFRLIFEELFVLETGLMYIKKGDNTDAGGISVDADRGDEFVKGLPFEFTEGQKCAWNDIKRDLASGKAMNRLIQGDVGSGKTALAEAAMFSCAVNGYQSVMMAPTEILAKQHYSSVSGDFEGYGIRTGLLCSSLKASEKKKVIQDLASGEIDVLIGTHAVISDKVVFHNLGLVITDEQHRFGVSQRKVLSGKGENTNKLVMTATPIPRTLAVILYGDLDISQIRTMPAGRKPVKTYKAAEKDRSRMYRFVKTQLSDGKQAYVVAPLIEDSEKLDAKSAEELYRELSETFSDYRVSLIHGAMKQEEKDQIMKDFAEGKTDMLISTVVIEVGINVPNATVMVIENCERFGLAQLHQLRGRVGRGSDDSYCFLVNYSDSEIASERIKTMCSTNDGFEIAEMDLKLRGPGEIFGTRQHGLPEMHISDIVRHAQVLESAKDAARKVIEEDPSLSKLENAELREKIRTMFGGEIELNL